MKATILIILVIVKASKTSQPPLEIDDGEDEESFLLPRTCLPAGTSPLSSVDIVFKLIGGQTVTPGEMPWMLKLEIFDRQNSPSGKLCGGFLINWKWALTAAHCLEGARVVVVSGGRTDDSLESPPEAVLNVTVDDFHLHPNYSDKINDIALLKLPRSLRSSQTIRPICILDDNSCQSLPRIQSDDENNCGMVFAAGWGTTDTELQSKVLRKINMTVVGARLCSRAYGDFTVGPNHLCAIGERFNSIHGPLYRDTCRGDSGGPLMCKIQGSMTAVGIVSFGKGCGAGRPGVYTRVCSYKNWIKQTMNITGCHVPRMDNGRFETFGPQVEQLSGGVFVGPNTSISLICNRNFNPNVTSGQSVISICQTDGLWLPKLADCVNSRTNCGTLPIISNGQVQASSHAIGSGAMIICNSRYQLEGDNILRCLSNGQWSAPSGNCIASAQPLPSPSCSAIPSVANGTISNGSFTVGSPRNIICSPNFDLEGAPQIFCQQNGQWSQPGRCVGASIVQCGNVPQLSNGKFNAGAREINSVRNLTCDVGYEIQGNVQIFCLSSGQWSTPGICVGTSNEEKLEIAILNDDSREIERLLTLGHSANTILDKCCDISNSSALICAACSNSFRSVMVLIRQGANINSMTSDQRSALMFAASSGNFNMVKYLVQYGARVDETTKSNKTLLMFAAEGGNLEMVKYFVDLAIAINASTTDGVTTLMIAAEFGHFEVVKYLVEHGALVNQMTDFERTPLMYAAEGGNIELVKYLLEKGADLNVSTSTDHWTPLMFASSKGHLGVVKFLVENGANVNETTMDQSTPLLYASMFGHLDVVQYLVEQGTDVNVGLKFYNHTPLMYAAWNGHFNLVRFLVQHGADVAAIDDWSRTASEWALENGHIEIASFLQIN